jgi:hypothetical protein
LSLPLKDVSRGKILERTAAALGFGFDLEIIGGAKPLYWYFIIRAASRGAAFVFSRDRRRLVFQVPLLMAFAWAGVSGLVLAGILMALGGVLAPLLKEFFPVRAYGSVGERLRPWKLCILFAFLALLFYGLVCFAWGLPVLPAVTGLVLFLCIEVLSIFWERRRRVNAGHIWFMPLSILPGRQALPPFSKAAGVFAAGALLAMALPFFMPALVPPGNGAAENYLTYIPSIDEYRRHMEFQVSFSFMPLGSRDGTDEYRHYLLGDDGLIIEGGGEWETPAGDFPPFPLEKLFLFLLDYNNGVVQDTSQGLNLKDMVLVALLIALCVPGGFHAGTGIGKKKKPTLLRDRRIAA